MSRVTAPMVAPSWGQISAYTSGAQLALSMKAIQSCDFPPDEGRVRTNSGE
jgi:hypothetical protein